MMFTIESPPIARPEDVPSTFFGVTDAFYLKTAGTPLLRGRDFSATDPGGTPTVALINQAFARRFFPHDNPIGQHILVLAGVVLGLAGNAPASRSMAGLLYGIAALDVLTVSAASVFLLTVATLASYLPARRATTRCARSNRKWGLIDRTRSIQVFEALRDKSSSLQASHPLQEC